MTGRATERENGWQVPIACCVAFVVTIASVGCDESPSHPSESVLRSTLQAVAYHDREGFLVNHIESTNASVYCSEESMKRLWESAAEVEPGRCDNLRDVTADEVESAPDELRFLLQVVRFRCEHPDASCSDYGARVLGDALVSSEVWAKRPTSWEIRKYIGDEHAAVAYVDLETPEGTLRRAVKLIQRDGRWYVASGLLQSENER